MAKRAIASRQEFLPLSDMPPAAPRRVQPVHAKAPDQPSEDLLRAQTLLRSVLVKDDLADEPTLLESVSVRVGELEMEVGELAGKQGMFELLMKS